MDGLIKVSRGLIGLERQVLRCPNDSPPIEAVQVIATGISLAANFSWRLSVELCLRYPVRNWFNRRMAIGHDLANAEGIIITGSLNNDQTVHQEVNNKEFQC